MFNKIVSALFVLSLFFVQSSTASEPDQGWQFEVTPFFWGLAIDGTSTIGGFPPQDINMGLDDILDNFNTGAALFGVAHNKQWSLITEITYLSLEKSTNVAGREISQNLDTYLFMAAAGYRLPIPVLMDLYAGARFVRFDVSSEINGVTTSLGGDQDWIDPLIGLRMSFPLSTNFSFNLNADMGGFGAGSEFSYMIMPVVEYRFTEWVSGKLAYRWLDVDYDKDDFAIDMLISGPMLGFTFKW